MLKTHQFQSQRDWSNFFGDRFFRWFYFVKKCFLSDILYRYAIYNLFLLIQHEYVQHFRKIARACAVEKVPLRSSESDVCRHTIMNKHHKPCVGHSLTKNSVVHHIQFQQGTHAALDKSSYHESKTVTHHYRPREHEDFWDTTIIYYSTKAKCYAWLRCGVMCILKLWGGMVTEVNLLTFGFNGLGCI